MLKTFGYAFGLISNGGATTCPLNPVEVKGGLLKKRVVKVEGPHVFPEMRVSKFMNCSTDYIVESVCDKCGEKVKRHFVQRSDLIRCGVSKDQLDAVDRDHFGITIVLGSKERE